MSQMSQMSQKSQISCYQPVTMDAFMASREGATMVLLKTGKEMRKYPQSKQAWVENPGKLRPQPHMQLREGKWSLSNLILAWPHSFTCHLHPWSGTFPSWQPDSQECCMQNELESHPQASLSDLLPSWNHHHHHGESSDNQ